MAIVNHCFRHIVKHYFSTGSRAIQGHAAVRELGGLYQRKDVAGIVLAAVLGNYTGHMQERVTAILVAPSMVLDE